MQGKGLTPVELVFRVVSATGAIQKNSAPYKGLKDCVAAFNTEYSPEFEVSYSKAYRNIREYGFHTEAFRYHKSKEGRYLYSCIVIVTGLDNKGIVPAKHVTDLFSQVESQELTVWDNGPGLSQVETNLVKKLDAVIEFAQREIHNADAYLIKLSKETGVGATQKTVKALKQVEEKKVPPAPRKATRKANKPAPGIQLFDVDKGEGLVELSQVKSMLEKKVPLRARKSKKA